MGPEPDRPGSPAESTCCDSNRAEFDTRDAGEGEGRLVPRAVSYHVRRAHVDLTQLGREA